MRRHFGVPRLSPRHHVLLEGLVERPFSLDLAALRGLRSHTQPVTLECAGNGRARLSPAVPGIPWVDAAVGTAVWTGVPLADLLAQAGPLPGATEVVFEGADRGVPQSAGDAIPFARSLPLSEAEMEGVLLAYEMNGAPIPPVHGGPIRLVVPRWYAMASVKWLRRIIVVDHPFQGWFQTQAYVYVGGAFGGGEPVTLLRPKTLIVSPAANAVVLPGPVLIRGHAWSADPIVQVELSIDGGRWTPVSFASAHPGSWHSFQAELELGPGRHRVSARAVDALGRTQPGRPEWNSLGYGANGVTTNSVVVSGR